MSVKFTIFNLPSGSLPIFTNQDELGKGRAIDSGNTGWMINSSGEVAGTYEASNGEYFGFTYSNGTFTTLSDPIAGVGSQARTYVTGITASGELTGYILNGSPKN